MKVYHQGEKAKMQESFIMSVAPAATAHNQEVPAHWVDDKNNPVQFQVEFIRGVAVVDDAMGEYLVEQGLARKTQLILPSFGLMNQLA
jgi:hypothetical protein